MLVPGTPLVIGRDPSRCTVAFPIDTSGVSGAHCSVAWDGTAFTVADLGSSYGTFVDGAKVEGTPKDARAGAVVTLGSDENAFRLTVG